MTDLDPEKRDLLIRNYDKARALLADARQQARMAENQILQILQETQEKFVRKHVYPAFDEIVRKLRGIQGEQTAARIRSGAEASHVPIARVASVKTKVPMKQVSGRGFQAYGYLHFSTHSDSLQHSFYAGFDSVEAIDDNFLPQLMTEGVDTVKLIRETNAPFKPNTHEILAEVRTDNLIDLAGALRLVEMLAIEATHVDTQGIIPLRALRRQFTPR